MGSRFDPASKTIYLDIYSNPAFPTDRYTDTQTDREIKLDVYISYLSVGNAKLLEMSKYIVFQAGSNREPTILSQIMGPTL